MRSCCFTGHRNCSICPETVKKEIIKYAEKGITDYFSGAALGWDLLCAIQIIELKTLYSNIHLNLVLPCLPDEQCAKWSVEDQKVYYSVYKAADRVECLSKHYYIDCYKVRNQRLVDLADMCICYYDERRFRSGTGQTVRMAHKKGIDVVNLFQINEKAE